MKNKKTEKRIATQLRIPEALYKDLLKVLPSHISMNHFVLNAIQNEIFAVTPFYKTKEKS